MKVTPLCLAFMILAAVACKQNREIKVYRVAKDAPPVAVHAAAEDPHAKMPGMMPGGVVAPASGGDPHAGLTADQLSSVPAGGGPQVADSPPPHWKKQPATSMRQASYLIEGAGGAVVDVSLVILRGAAGGTLENVNRWRGQLGLAPIDDVALKQTSTVLVTPVGEAVAVEIEGLAPGADPAKDGRLLGVIANHNADAWFYKMRGNTALAASQKEHFLAWVQSVKPASTAEPVPPPAAAVSPAATTDGSLAWQVPAGWSAVPANSSMRYATFNIAGADGVKGEMAVTHFPGNVGGDLDNVNRWRQQVALPPVDQSGMAALVSSVTAGPKTFSMVDLTGSQNRLVAGWTRHGAETWFFKLTGPYALVAVEKARFTAFLESVRFTKPE